MASGNFSEFAKPRKTEDPPRYERIQQTEKMPLDGGVPIPFKVKMFHSVHNSLFEDGNS
jgi:hypothetical protein